MNKRYIKQNKKFNKKEINKYSTLKNIIKNIERNYLSFAFNIWAEPFHTEENENIYVNYHSSKINSQNNSNFINNDIFNRENNLNYKNGRPVNDLKKYIIEWRKNSIKRIEQNENDNNFKMNNKDSLKSIKSDKIYKKKEVKRPKTNRNNIPVPYKIKLSVVQNNNNSNKDLSEIKLKKDNEMKKNDFSLLILTDEDEKNNNIEYNNDNRNDSFNENKEIDSSEINIENNNKEENNVRKIKLSSRNKKIPENRRNDELNLKNMKSADFTRRRGIKYNKKMNHLYTSDIMDDENDSEKNKDNQKDLTKLTKLINNINNKSKYFARLYFDRWHQETINYKNEENIRLTEINNEPLINNQDNIKQNYNINKEENKKRHNIIKKAKIFYKTINTPFEEQNEAYENFNMTNSHSYDRKIKTHNSKNFIKPKNIVITNEEEEEYNLIYSKEIPLSTDPDITPKHHKKNQKSKKKRRINKKQNILNVTPLDTPNIIVDLDENKENSKSNDNLGKHDLTPTFKSKYLQHKSGIQNSFVNKYFKSRAINYSKEEINPDVIDIQIRQEKETESEKLENMIKIFKKGFHILRKVIRSFQKRKTKGNSKDILRIYINKWKRIVKQSPEDNYTDLYSVKDNEDNSPKNITSEYDNNKNIYENNNNHYNNSLLKKLNNHNNINFIEDSNTNIDLYTKSQTIKYSSDSEEDFNDNKIITKTIEVPNSQRGSSAKKRANKFNKNKLIKSQRVHEFDLSNSYDRIIRKDKKRPKSKKNENLQVFNNLVKKINKKNDEKLLYKYFDNWHDMTFNSFDYIPYHHTYKTKTYKNKKYSKNHINEKVNKTIVKEEDQKILIKDLNITEFKYKNKNKKHYEYRKNNKSNDKKKKEHEKYNNSLYELKEEIRKAIFMNNDILKIVKEGGNLSFINNCLKFVKAQNKILVANKIFYCYNNFNDNYYFKLRRILFYKWLKHNKIFKNTIQGENHIKSKNNHCINCNCSNIFDVNCIDCNCSKIKNLLKKILIRHFLMKKMNFKKYYLYLWYKKVFKAIRKI